MAGMSLLSSLPPPPGRKVSTSSVSSSPPYPNEDDIPQHQSYISRGSAPSSPSYDTKHFMLNSKAQSRPPGLSSIALPSPIGKPGHTKDLSSTSPLLTLTPNSSIDGSSDWANIGRQASPFQASEGPTVPYLHVDGRVQSQPDDIVSTFSTLDVSDNDNDGLLGLDAFRDRANSLPSITTTSLQSNSPPVSTRGYFHSQIIPPQTLEYEQRPRSSRDRPPLSQSHGESAFHSSDRSNVGGSGIMSNPYSTGSSSSSRSSVGEANNISVDSSDSRVLGTIGRPELRHGATEYEPGRRRASSGDNLQNPYYHQQQALTDQTSNKFRALPAVNLQMPQSQKRMPDMYSDVHKSRHVRSISQPGPAVNVSGFNQQYVTANESHFFPQQPHSYSDQSSFKPSRSISISNNFPSQSYDAGYFDKGGSSLPDLSATLGGGHGGFQTYSTSQRREAFDYHLNSGNQVTDDISSYGGNSPLLGQSPRHGHYGSHLRQASEGSMLPSAYSGLNTIHGHGSFGLPSNFDDDLVLAGENIDFPDHDDPHNQDIAETFYINQPNAHPLLRSATHSHSMSLDAIPSQYIDGSHRTAGAPMQTPKVVYAIKFKRSQRNFVLGPRISRDLKIGTYVKVEADRGEDLGIVVGKVAAEKYSFSARSSFSAGMGPPPTLGSGPSDLKRIIRLATHDEVSLLSLKREEEEELLKICRRKVHERCLRMNVVDAEYQFDRHKLTFFFEAEGRVDFRELVRDLFSIYKTRIWMQQLDKNTSTSAQAIVFPQAANLQMDFGTPIIAPPSEFADSIILNGLSGFDSRSH